jgi:disulfide bond formation protein DsbB
LVLHEGDSFPCIHVNNGNIIMQNSLRIDAVTAGRWAWLSRRPVNGLGVLICSAGLLFAYYGQFYLGLAPCPLCILQRLALFAIGLALLVAMLHHPQDWGARAYGALIGLLAAMGTGIAARHVWLQHLPPEEAPRCGPGLDYMLETLPLNETLREVLTGSGECAEVDWTLLGFSMPEWTLVLFIGLGVAGVMNNWRRR